MSSGTCHVMVTWLEPRTIDVLCHWNLYGWYSNQTEGEISLLFACLMVRAWYSWLIDTLILPLCHFSHRFFRLSLIYGGPPMFFFLLYEMFQNSALLSLNYLRYNCASIWLKISHTGGKNMRTLYFIFMPKIFVDVLKFLSFAGRRAGLERKNSKIAAELTFSTFFN